MNPEWLPDWWIQSAAYKWMGGPGDWIVPLYLHLSALILEILAFRRLEQALPKHNSRIKVSLVLILVAHLVLFILTFFMADGGITYYYWSGIWAFGMLWVALTALVVSRRAKNPAAGAKTWELATKTPKH